MQTLPKKTQALMINHNTFKCRTVENLTHTESAPSPPLFSGFQGNTMFGIFTPVLILFPCSPQLSRNYILLMNISMQTNVVYYKINFIINSVNGENYYIVVFFYKLADKFHAQLSCA